jgi:hypothetical protein
MSFVTDGSAIVVRNPCLEASQRVGGLAVRVLEPSPPADKDPSFYADDPVGPTDDAVQVSPVEGLGQRTWAELAGEDADLAGFCRDRGLAAWNLPPLPNTFATTRLALHGVAEHVLAAARFAANGKIGLRFTKAGFGTPFFGEDRQVRVEAGVLVVDGATVPLTTLGAAAEATPVPLGAPPLYRALTPADPDLDLASVVDPVAAEVLGAWYGFAWAVLEQLRHDAAATAPSRVQLWPEHFDPAVDLGDQAAGSRATYGASPGDEAHDQPYLYVSPWVKRSGDMWNDNTFQGASLGYDELRQAPDPRQRALEFLRTAWKVLT